jgi:signal transduction histidine kinase
MARTAANLAVVLLADATADARDALRELGGAGVHVVDAPTMAAARDAVSSLLQQVQARDDLAHMAVHNLKTPLTTLLASLEMMADGDLGELTPRQSAAVASMREQGTQMFALVESLLEIGRLETPGLELTLEPVHPVPLLREVAQEWESRLEQANARLLIAVVPDLPAVPGDRAVLHHVFGNLVNNALIHADGPVSVQLTADLDDSAVVFSVADDGPGISAEYHDLIFRKFARVPPRGARRVAGSGLGLAYCQLAVEAHGGRIWVESDGVRGSTFRVRIPAIRPAVPAGPG